MQAPHQSILIVERESTASEGTNISSEIIVAVVACIGTVIGSGLGVLASNKLVTFRLEQLEKKVEKHNCLVERVTVVERDIKTAFNKIEFVEERI